MLLPRWLGTAVDLLPTSPSPRCHVEKTTKGILRQLRLAHVAPAPVARLLPTPGTAAALAGGTRGGSGGRGGDAATTLSAAPVGLLAAAPTPLHACTITFAPRLARGNVVLEAATAKQRTNTHTHTHNRDSTKPGTQGSGRRRSTCPSTCRNRSGSSRCSLRGHRAARQRYA